MRRKDMRITNRQQYEDHIADAENNLVGLRSIYATLIQLAGEWQYYSKDELIDAINIINKLIAMHDIDIAEAIESLKMDDELRAKASE